MKLACIPQIQYRYQKFVHFVEKREQDDFLLWTVRWIVHWVL